MSAQYMIWASLTGYPPHSGSVCLPIQSRAKSGSSGSTSTSGFWKSSRSRTGPPARDGIASSAPARATCARCVRAVISISTRWSPSSSKTRVTSPSMVSVSPGWMNPVMCSQVLRKSLSGPAQSVTKRANCP